jgi:LPS-assembly protein
VSGVISLLTSQGILVPKIANGLVSNSMFLYFSRFSFLSKHKRAVLALMLTSLTLGWAPTLYAENTVEEKPQATNIKPKDTETPKTEQSSENSEIKEGKKGIARYWFTEKELSSLPESTTLSQPLLSPQCRGAFFHYSPSDSFNESEPPETNESSEEQSGEKAEQQTITADRVLYQADGTSVFEGNVVITQGAQRISGDAMYYHHEQDTVKAKGRVQIENQGLLISSDEAEYNNSEQSSVLHNAEFLMFENALNGTAKRIYVSENETEVKSSTITTCPPGKESWLLKSSELHLDQEKGWGYAKHASLRLAKVPVLYTPYFTFPLDDRRKTGFLYPTLGSDSVNGTDIAIPYYLNIAPNYDATLTPRILSKRGEQLAGEFRYLNATGEGSISGDYLGQDEINPLYSERKQAQWHHYKSFSPGWHFDADYYYVSDSDYFDDLDSFTNFSSIGYLERKALISYLGSHGYFNVLAQDFQVLDTISETDEPYRLAPQVNAGVEHTFNKAPLGVGLDAQASQFERDLNPANIGSLAISQGELTTGQRLVMQPRLFGELSDAGYFFKPSATLHHRQYRLDDYQAVDDEADLEYNVPVYSLDTGLIFERDLSFANQSYWQTLEPRIKLTKIPFREQSDAPNFDSGLLSINEEKLFNERRYSGHDLVGDTEQVALGLASRFFDEQGGEKAVFSIGQIAYLEDREIRIDENEDLTEKYSPVFANASIQLLPNWTIAQQVQWDSEENQIDQAASGIYFKNELRKIANLEFRYRPEDSSSPLKETRASFMWPLANRWSAMSFWNYDMLQESTIELASGLEYENCCVIVRALNQKWLRKVSSTSSYESANKQSLEIQLKGLGRLNNQISNYLSHRIPGFSEQ